jgi:UDP-N-acetyl-D-glucosamine dehydrogenase
MNVCVIGLGKIGLPLAVQFARKGAYVVGVDINPVTVETVNRGSAPFPGEANLKEYLNEVVRLGKLSASTKTSESVAQSDVVLVAVPLFVNAKAEPDFKALDDATESIGLGLKPGTLVLYETTLPIGTTRNRFTVALEKISGLRVGEDFNVAFSPERVLTGRVFADLKRYPKIVGGVTRMCSSAAERFYLKVLEFEVRPDLTPANGVWIMETSEAAEFVKLAETTYRDVNIGLANQFAIYASSIGINIHDVIKSANSQTYSHLHQPGIAVGGHCIPIYPLLYLSTDPDASLVALARTINAQMPSHSIERVVAEFGSINERRILILGASYRAHVKETAFSGVFSLIKAIKEYGGLPEVFDPLYDANELEALGIPPYKEKSLGIKIAVIQNEDESYKSLLADRKKFADLELIFDGRNIFRDISEINGVRISSI